MMGLLSRTVLFSLLSAALAPFGAAAHAQAPQDPQTVSSESRELARRRMAVRDAMQEVQEARLAYAAKRYTQAEEHYRNALAVMPDVPATQRQRTFICQSLADALIARAVDYRAVGRHEEAAQFLRDAVQLDPGNNRAKTELAYTQDPVRTNPALTPQHVGNVAEVERLLELANGYIDLGLFDDAVATFQSVLRIDSHNSAARRGMEAVEKRRSAYYASARQANRARLLAQADAEWEEPVPAEVSAPADEAANGDSTALTDDSLKQSYVDRLSEMVLPNIVFDDVRIADVVEALQNQISRFEADGNIAGGRHINLTANFGSPDSPAYKQLAEQSINMTLSDVSVKDILDMLVTRLGIRYFYTPVGVELCLGDRDSGPLLDRTFKVPPHFFDPRSDSEEEDGGFSSEEVSVSRVNPVQVLKGMGITFPKGAVAVYSPSTRSLRVRNTAQNLEDIEAALDVPMDQDSQIVLSVIAMEVFENDLNQLGFEWLLNLSLGSNAFLSGGVSQSAISTATGAPVISTELGTNNSPAMSSGLRGAETLRSADSMESLIESGSSAYFNSGSGAKSPSIFGIRGVWNVADVTFIMNGLSQKKGVDIMQNPKLTFSPGVEEQVSVGSVDEMFFPETWEQGEVSTSNNNNNNSRIGGNKYSYSPIASGANPTDFVRLGCSDDAVDGLGTILLIHKAELEETAQGTFVNLALTTVIKQFEGFINWGSPINSAVISGERMEYIELTPNYILQPMIKRYVENTQIKVAPGSVIVMGGLKEAKNIKFEDKIPVLGDLPLVGRLFRSSGETKQRKALIFFVKVDYVDPTGKNPVTGERPSQEM